MTVRSFSYAKDVREKHKIKTNKPERPLLNASSMKA